MNQGGYIPGDAQPIELAGCQYLVYNPSDDPRAVLDAALADTETDWVIPSALIKALRPHVQGSWPEKTFRIHFTRARGDGPGERLQRVADATDVRAESADEAHADFGKRHPDHAVQEVWELVRDFR